MKMTLQIQQPTQKDFIQVGRVEIMKDNVRLQDGSYALADHYDAIKFASQYGLRLPYVDDLWRGYQVSRAIKKSMKQLALKSGEWSGEVILREDCLARPRKAKYFDGEKMYTDVEIFYLEPKVCEDDGYAYELNRFAIPTKLTPRPHIMRKGFPYWWSSGSGAITISYTEEIDNQLESFVAGVTVNEDNQQAFRFVRDAPPKFRRPEKLPEI